MARLAVLPLVLLLGGASATEVFCQFLCAPSQKADVAGCHHAAGADDGTRVTSAATHGCDHALTPATLAAVRIDAQAAAGGSVADVRSDAASRAAGIGARLGPSPPASSLPPSSVLRI